MFFRCQCVQKNTNEGEHGGDAAFNGSFSKRLSQHMNPEDERLHMSTKSFCIICMK